MNKSVVYSTNSNKYEIKEEKMTQYLQNFQNHKLFQNSPNNKYEQTSQYSQNTLQSQISSNKFRSIECRAEKEGKELPRALNTSQFIGDEPHPKISSQISNSFISNKCDGINKQIERSTGNRNSAISGSSKFINSFIKENKTSSCINPTYLTLNRTIEANCHRDINQTRIPIEKSNILNNSIELVNGCSKNIKYLSSLKKMNNSETNIVLDSLKEIKDFKESEESKELRGLKKMKENDSKFNPEMPSHVI